MTIEIPKLIERFGGDVVTNLLRLIDSKLTKVHTTTIGVIESFDSEKQIAVIQPAIKRLVTVENRETITYTTENSPLLVNVPIVFPGGGDWFMTFPVKRGDECLIFSMERSIGKWKKNGGVQDPSNYKRKLSFKDAVAMVGIQSQASSLPDFNADEPELRNRAGDIKLTMTDTGINLIGDTDNAVRYSSLETAYNQLKSEVDQLIIDINTLKGHGHPVATTGTATAQTGATTGITPVIPIQPSSTGNIVPSKIDEIKVP